MIIYEEHTEQAKYKYGFTGSEASTGDYACFSWTSCCPACCFPKNFAKDFYFNGKCGDNYANLGYIFNYSGTAPNKYIGALLDSSCGCHYMYSKPLLDRTINFFNYKMCSLSSSICSCRHFTITDGSCIFNIYCSVSCSCYTVSRSLVLYANPETNNMDIYEYNNYTLTCLCGFCLAGWNRSNMYYCFINSEWYSGAGGYTRFNICILNYGYFDGRFCDLTCALNCMSKIQQILI